MFEMWEITIKGQKYKFCFFKKKKMCWHPKQTFFLYALRVPAYMFLYIYLPALAEIINHDYIKAESAPCGAVDGCWFKKIELDAKAPWWVFLFVMGGPSVLQGPRQLWGLPSRNSDRTHLHLTRCRNGDFFN